MTHATIELGVIKPISICRLLFVKIEAPPRGTRCMRRPIRTGLQGRILPIENAFRSSRYINLDIGVTARLHYP